jgi:hypothetical protein
MTTLREAFQKHLEHLERYADSSESDERQTYLFAVEQIRKILEQHPETPQPITLNDSIHLKLTESGYRVWADSQMEAGVVPHFNTDERGYSRFELWVFAQLFGPHLFHGQDLQDMPCEMEGLLERNP